MNRAFTRPAKSLAALVAPVRQAGSCADVSVVVMLHLSHICKSLDGLRLCSMRLLKYEPSGDTSRQHIDRPQHTLWEATDTANKDYMPGSAARCLNYKS